VPQTLLLADDSVTIQRVIELTFADEDINVLAVSDGDQAIERIDADPPDIVLVDVGMPGRSGYEVARYIKESPRLSHIPVLLLTGAFEPVDETQAAAAGCDGVLAKPFEPQLVIARVKELLERSAPPFGSRPPQVARLDSYFAQLDEAFSTLGEGSPAERAELEEVAAPPLDPPLASAAPDTSAESAPAPGDAPPARPAPAPSSPPAALPPLADAFAAILAAEQQEPMPALAAVWPASASSANGGGQALTEEAIEDITRRVLDRLSDRVVRETVASLVTDIAERLVREEIERIKSSIK
jgi:CheY-like chemotaxis protein